MNSTELLKHSPTPPVRVVNTITKMLGSLLKVSTMPWRLEMPVDPSKRMYLRSNFLVYSSDSSGVLYDVGLLLCNISLKLFFDVNFFGCFSY